MRNTVLATLFLLLSTAALAQGDETVVSKFKLDFSGAWGGWHPTLTQVGDQNVVMNGGFGGLEFNKSLFIGWAAYRVSDQIGQQGIVPARKFDFTYTGPTVQYTPYARNVAHPKFGLQVGFGNFNIDAPIEGEPDLQDRIVIIQPSIGGELNILRWFRLGGDLGYRYAINGDPGVGDEFGSGFFAAATLKFGFSWGSGDNDND